VNAIFCVPFTKAYGESYKYHILYWGAKAGNKYANNMIDTCTLTKHPNFIIIKHRTAQYHGGFIDGYKDSVELAFNNNGTYGAKDCK
jgi:hypothetical protein